MRICIVTGASPANNPRAVKEADALVGAGHDVTVVGCRADDTQWQYDKKIVERSSWEFLYVDYLPSRVSSLAARTLYRIQGRIGKLLYENWGIVTPYLYGYGLSKLKRLARRVDADLTIGHNESGLHTVVCLLKEGRRVAFDFEDWHSEDLLPVARRWRPLEDLRKLEARILKDAVYCSAASEPMAEALSRKYGAGCPFPVLNVFPLASVHEAESRRWDNDKECLSVAWFSQTLGPGRGLEDVFLAIRDLDIRLHLHLLGKTNDSTRRWLESQIPAGRKNHIHVYDPLPPWEVFRWVGQFDLGLSVDPPNCRSRDLTVTNKMFTYMLCGLGVIATDTAGHRSVFSANPLVGAIYTAGDFGALSRILASFAVHRDRLKQVQSHSAKAALERYNWDLESFQLVRAIESGWG